MNLKIYTFSIFVLATKETRENIQGGDFVWWFNWSRAFVRGEGECSVVCPGEVSYQISGEHGGFVRSVIEGCFRIRFTRSRSFDMFRSFLV